jgi:hypothetical protein
MVALAAEGFARVGGSGAAATRRGAAAEDLARFVTPLSLDSASSRRQVSVAADPFEVAAISMLPADSEDVDRPTTARARLTAILVADNSRVAVIDDATVSVGDYLRDGSRVTAIQSDRVWLVERSGQWRMLSLTSPGQ